MLKLFYAETFLFPSQCYPEYHGEKEIVCDYLTSESQSQNSGQFSLVASKSHHYVHFNKR